MFFTTAQIAAIKAEILADPVLAAKPMNSDGALDIAAALNLPAVPDFYVWQTAVPTQIIFDNITWANFTPSDAADGTAVWTNRSLACQGKQFNVQTLLMGQQSVNAAKSNIRAGLQDALTAIPSGAGGANKNGGWSAVQLAIQRKATRLEKLLATGAGTTVSPATMTFEGNISYQDVEIVRAS